MVKVPRYDPNQVSYTPAKAAIAPLQLADMSSWTQALDAGAAFAADKYAKRQLAEQEIAVRDAQNKMEELISESGDKLQHSKVDDPDKPFNANDFKDDAFSTFDEGVAKIMSESTIISSGDLNVTNHARFMADIDSARSRIGRQANSIASNRLVDRLQQDFHSRERVAHQAIVHGADPKASFDKLLNEYTVMSADNDTLGYFSRSEMEQKVAAGTDLAIDKVKTNLADRFANDLLGNARGSEFKGQVDFNAWEDEVKVGDWDDFIKKGGIESKDSFINDVFAKALTAESTMKATMRKRAKIDFAQSLGIWIKKSGDPNVVITADDLKPLFDKLEGGAVYLEGNDLISAFNKIQGLITDPTQPTAVQDQLFENMRTFVAMQTVAGMDAVTTADLMQSVTDEDAIYKFSDLHYSNKADFIKYLEDRNDPQTQKVDAAIAFVYKEWQRDLSKKTNRDRSLEGSFETAFGVAGNVLFPELASGRLAPFSRALIESSVRAYVRDNPTHSAMKAQSEVMHMLTSQVKKGNHSDVTKIDIDDRILEEAIYKKNIQGGVLNYKEEVALGLYDIKTKRLRDLQERIIGEYSYLKKGDLRDVLMDKFSQPQRISKATGRPFDAKVIKEKMDMFKEAASLIEPLHFSLLQADTRAKRRARDFNQSKVSQGSSLGSMEDTQAEPKVQGKTTPAHEKISPEEVNNMIKQRAEELGLDATQFLVNPTDKSPVKTAVPKKTVTTPKADADFDEYTRRQGENSKALYYYGREWEEASKEKYGSFKSVYTSKEGKAYIADLKKQHPLKFLRGTALMKAIRKSRKGE